MAPKPPYLPILSHQCLLLADLLPQELEKELELQIGLKTEMEIAMKLLEKDTHEKQDTLVALRQQLEDVKAINLQMFHKVQVGVALVRPWRVGGAWAARSREWAWSGPGRDGWAGQGF